MEGEPEKFVSDGANGIKASSFAGHQTGTGKMRKKKKNSKALTMLSVEKDCHYSPAHNRRRQLWLQGLRKSRPQPAPVGGTGGWGKRGAGAGTPHETTHKPRRTNHAQLPDGPVHKPKRIRNDPGRDTSPRKLPRTQYRTRTDSNTPPPKKQNSKPKHGKADSTSISY